LFKLHIERYILKIQTEFTDDHQAKLTVEFEPEVLEQYKRRAARKLAKETRIPGFRPGKAPYNMVVNYVGEDTILNEAIDLMVDKFYPEVIKEAGIEPSGPGSLDDVTNIEDSPVFFFTVPLEPTVELGGLDDLKEPYVPPIISEEEVQSTLFAVRRNASTIIPLDTPAKEGDLVFFTLSAVNAQAQEGEEVELIQSTPQQVFIPTEKEQNETEWPFKGFARQLIGVSAGDELEIEHQFSDDTPDGDLVGKRVIFKVKVQSVKGLELPEVDEDFLQKMGDFNSREEIEEYIRNSMQTSAKAEYDENYYNGLIDRIREKSSIKYPPQVLSEEVENVLDDLEHELSHQQMNLDLYLKLRKLDKEDFIKKEVRPSAVERLERSLIKQAIEKKYDIQISKEELERQISNVLTELIRSGELEEVQRSLGERKFTQAVSILATKQALEEAIRLQLRRLAAPESLQAEDREEQSSQSEVSAEEIQTEQEKEPAAEEETEPESKA